jgi:hypothetical protein
MILDNRTDVIIMTEAIAIDRFNDGAVAGFFEMFCMR